MSTKIFSFALPSNSLSPVLVKSHRVQYKPYKSKLPSWGRRGKRHGIERDPFPESQPAPARNPESTRRRSHRTRWRAMVKILVVRYKMHPGFGANFRVLEPVDFVAAVTGHIPDKGRHTVRRYGYYSNRSRGKRRLGGKGELILTSPAAGEERELTRRWRKMLKRIYEVDPLICPQCGSYLAIIGFVSDAAGIRTTLRSLGLREEEEVPASARPPPELTYELLPQESLFPEELPVIFLN